MSRPTCAMYLLNCANLLRETRGPICARSPGLPILFLFAMVGLGVGALGGPICLRGFAQPQPIIGEKFTHMNDIFKIHWLYHKRISAQPVSNIDIANIFRSG